MAALLGLQGNDKVAFVQARWVFANADESTLTRVQEISLNYHLKCEQFARFASSAFWNFNGELTAEVPKAKCSSFPAPCYSNDARAPVQCPADALTTRPMFPMP